MKLYNEDGMFVVYVSILIAVILAFFDSWVYHNMYLNAVLLMTWIILVIVGVCIASEGENRWRVKTKPVYWKDGGKRYET